jgi:hypothetical protein
MPGSRVWRVRSHATAPPKITFGTCSHHGGVARWLVTLP